ncbi:MAG: efflux RND transporter periplasmic adaptor subunit [Hyphomicrobiales bacterium]|nr:MAG: efflux RND transporter periplasmic adaptor subunit [Hyphomicrobiales bacterium]
MSDDQKLVPKTRGRLIRTLALAAVVLSGGALVVVKGANWLSANSAAADQNSPQPPKPKKGNTFTPTDAQWATFAVEQVKEQVFLPFDLTEGKIAVNEDRSTSIFSPYSGRILKLLVKPGDDVKRGQPLFVIEATDAVQVHNDFITSIAAVNKSRSQVNLTQTVEKRLRDLYEIKAVALKDWQQAQADLISAQNDLSSAEAALEAARNRLRILGRTDAEIDSFQQRRTITPETAIFAPIDGTIVQRKAGPGQFITGGSSDPVFIIGDLSSVWLTAYVRETEAPHVKIGQTLRFKVLSYPDRVFTANVSYVASSIDPNTRRLLVRATIDNPDGVLRPEMFANVTIVTGQGGNSIAVPRIAVIYEGQSARVWVANDDKSLELRNVKLGLVSGNYIQVLEGLKPGEKVVTRGSLFIDREASAN